MSVIGWRHPGRRWVCRIAGRRGLAGRSGRPSPVPAQTAGTSRGTGPARERPAPRGEPSWRCRGRRPSRVGPRSPVDILTEGANTPRPAALIPSPPAKTVRRYLFLGALPPSAGRRKVGVEFKASYQRARSTVAVFQGAQPVVLGPHAQRGFGVGRERQGLSVRALTTVSLARARCLRLVPTAMVLPAASWRGHRTARASSTVQVPGTRSQRAPVAYTAPQKPLPPR